MEARAISCLGHAFRCMNLSWIIYLAMEFIQRDLGAADLYIWPILLFGPPLALLIFGRGALWARHGFKAS